LAVVNEKQRLRRAQQTDEMKQAQGDKRRQRDRELNADPVRREAAVQHVRERRALLNADPVRREANLEKERQRSSERRAKLNADPMRREAHLEKRRQDYREHRAKLKRQRVQANDDDSEQSVQSNGHDVIVISDDESDGDNIEVANEQADDSGSGVDGIEDFVDMEALRRAYPNEAHGKQS
jgi:hypothetical protein